MRLRLSRKNYSYLLILSMMAYFMLAYYIHFHSRSESNEKQYRLEDTLHSIQNTKMKKMFGVKSRESHHEEVTATMSFHSDNGTEDMKFDDIIFDEVEFLDVQGIYVYATFLDQRLKNSTYVRIFALQEYTNLESILCHFRDNRTDNIILVYSEKYEMCENHGKKYAGYIYSCLVPQTIDDLPENINLSTYSIQARFFPTVSLKKLLPSDTTAVNKFLGICVPPIFGNIQLNYVVQYIELAKILGASKLFFYKYNITQTLEKLLKYYSARGEIEVLEWNLPKSVKQHDIWYNGQLLAIQDCLYRNMANYKFLLFMDLDELLMPRETKDWVAMLHKLSVKNPNFNDLAAFSFQSVFFDPKQMPDPEQSLRLLQLLDRTKITSSVRSKLIVKPAHIFELGIHHVSKKMQETLTVMNVSPNDALLHHYRTCTPTFDANMKCYPVIRDDVILKYTHLLTERTNNVMSYISKVLK